MSYRSARSAASGCEMLVWSGLLVVSITGTRLRYFDGGSRSTISQGQINGGKWPASIIRPARLES